MSGVSDLGEDVGFQTFGPHRESYRFLHATPRPGSRSSPIRDDSGAGHVAAVSSGGHTVAQSEGDGGQGQRLDLAPTSGAVGADRSVGAGSCRAGRPVAWRSDPDSRQLFGAGQAGRRPHWPQSDRPRQAGHQIPHRDHRRRRAGRLRRHRGQHQRHFGVRASVPGRLCRHGADPDRVRRQIQTVFADKGYDAEPHRALCWKFGAEPCIHKRGQPQGSGLGQRRWPVERSNAWVLENKRLALRYDRLGFIIQSLLQAACIFLVAGRVAHEL